MKKIFSTILSICLLSLVLVTSACSSSCMINVTNGTGGGEYKKGESVTITATVPKYQDFDYWECNGQNVSNENPYTFIAKEDATYNAVFKAQKATLTVIDGSGSGTYDKGTSVTVSATVEANTVFNYWKVNGRKVSSENPYTFTLTEDITILAIFKYTTAQITVVNGTGSGTYDVGEEVTITADIPQGKVFDYWECEGTNVSQDNPYTFNVSKNVTYTAIFKEASSRGVKRTNTTPINIIPINVSKGGIITIDYKYIDPVTDKDNGVSIFLGTSTTNCFGKYKIFSDHLDESYTGVTFSALEDGYYRLVIDVSKLNQVRSDCVAPTNITQILFRWFEAGEGVYFDVKSEPVVDNNRGYLYKNAGTSISLSKTYTVSEGGTLVIDYKYKDPVTDKDNGVSLFFGTDETNRFGKYKIFNDHLDDTYNGVTFEVLEDGYYRMTIDISKLDQVRSEYNAPTTITQISFRWFEAGEGVYFDVNPQDKKVKQTEFQMEDDNFIVVDFTDIHVDDASLLSENGTVGKTIRYGIMNSSPDIIVFSGDVVGSSSDLDYFCTFMDSFGIPYFLILGNHDHEGSLGYDSIAQKINESEYGYIEKGPDGIGSEGNYTVKIKNSKGELVHALVLMDTGNKYTVTDDSLVEYVNNPISGVLYGTYKTSRTYCDPGWNGIRDLQIDWYKATVDSLNCETTLICHIPFLEYCKAYEQYRKAVNNHDNAAIAACAPIGECNMGEQICGSMENLGFFSAILEKNSTKNVICGHDHLNDFSLLYNGVRLTYAIKTGSGAYWKNDGTRCGYTVLTISSTGEGSIDQIYYNPLSK